MAQWREIEAALVEFFRRRDGSPFQYGDGEPHIAVSVLSKALDDRQLSTLSVKRDAPIEIVSLTALAKRLEQML